MSLGITSGITVPVADPAAISALHRHGHIPISRHLSSKSECLYPPFSLLPRLEASMLQVAIFKPPCIPLPPLSWFLLGQCWHIIMYHVLEEPGELILMKKERKVSEMAVWKSLRYVSCSALCPQGNSVCLLCT